MNGLNHQWRAVGRACKGWRLAGCGVAALAVLLAAQGPAFGAESAGAQPAVWVKKNILFIYHGFTSAYSCEGLQETVTDVLRQLGARKSGMDLRQTNCAAGFNIPSTNPGISGSFYVLEPASSSTSDAIQAEWQTVKVHIGTADESSTGRDKQGTCELIDQVKRKILPLFTTRNVKFESICQPNMQLIRGSALQAEVLKPTVRAASDASGAAR